MRKLPQYFQLGTVISGRDEGANYRIRKKNIRKSILDEYIGYDRKVNHSRGQFLELQRKNRKVVRSYRFKKAKKHMNNKNWNKG
jgi:hypothetical protein